jgi:hypothetical protein
MLTHNGRPKYKAYTIKQLEVELNKKPEGKKRAKLVQELNRKLQHEFKRKKLNG